MNENIIILTNGESYEAWGSLVELFDKRISYFKDYADVKPKLNPPFSSVFLTKDILPKQVVLHTM